MMLKVVAAFTLIALCYAEEQKSHAYSSQSIVLHHTEHHEPEHHEPHEPEHHESHKPEHHEYHQPEHVEVVVPVVTKKVVPVVQYVVESSSHDQYGHRHEHHDHKHAISSQHIERHDIPAEPPKGFFDHYGPSKYEFEYKVHDPHTHDVKQQHEARDGHKVHGVYSLHEADGSIRTVHYSADKKTGFQADVKHTTKHVEESKLHY